MGQAVIMTQRKCDFILTLMLGLQTAIEPDIVWKRERERERAEAAARKAQKQASKAAAKDTAPSSPLATLQHVVLRSFMAPPPWQGLPAGAEGGLREEFADNSLPKFPSCGEFGSMLMEGGVEHRTFEIPQLLYRKNVASSASFHSDDDVGGDRSSCSWGCLPGLERIRQWMWGMGAAGGRANSTITAFGVRLFRDIRRAFGVSEETFLASLGIKQVLGGLLMGDMRNVAERVSEGRSGSFFYYSHDGKFMVKTISRAESMAMRDMLPDYYSYVLENPDTLLMRILGQFDLHHDRQTYHLVVLANVFNTTLPIHERFDLKGSSFKRTLGRRRGTPGLVHRDLDFMQTGRRLTVANADLANKLRLQIAKVVYTHIRNLSLSHTHTHTCIVHIMYICMVANAALCHQAAPTNRQGPHIRNLPHSLTSSFPQPMYLAPSILPSLPVCLSLPLPPSLSAYVITCTNLVYVLTS